jgi:hypothetical protein
VAKLAQDLRHLIDALRSLEDSHTREYAPSPNQVGKVGGTLWIARCHSLTPRRA